MMVGNTPFCGAPGYVKLQGWKARISEPSTVPCIRSNEAVSRLEPTGITVFFKQHLFHLLASASEHLVLKLVAFSKTRHPPGLQENDCVLLKKNTAGAGKTRVVIVFLFFSKKFT